MKPFVPTQLPLTQLDWKPLVPLIGPANRAIARFSGILHGLQHPEIFIAPLTTQEAVLSSRIEGTQATLGEVLQFEAGAEAENTSRKEDIYEILNYRKALKHAQSALQPRPFNLNLLLDLHDILLDSVRGRNKGRGRFRTIQNWIGSTGSAIEEAAFVPPAPENVLPALTNWENYYHDLETPDVLVQLAVIHAQFEIIHPFLDGNGRLGRILIPIFLYEKNLLTEPVFYLSEYFEKSRDEYVERLRAIGTRKNAWNAWIEFFLTALTRQAETNVDTAQKIIALHNQLKVRVIDLTKSKFAVPLLDALFERPIFAPSSLEGRGDLPSKQMIMKMLGRLREAEILTVLRESSGQKSQILCFPTLLDICEGRR